MLTAELLSYQRRAGVVVPILLDPQAPDLRAAAAALLAVVEAHVGRSRGELEEALRSADGSGLEPRALAGLTRLLLERCEFEVRAQVEPVRLREAVFDAAAAAWRAAEDAGGAGWRTAVLERAAAPLGLTAEAADEALFADLEEQQRLRLLEPLRPESLLFRYNTAQVQGLLLRAERVRIAASWPGPQRLRQLLRYLRFYGLLYDLEPAPAAVDAGGLALTVDGPLSVLESATSYGLNLAEFLPALLLWEQPWTLEASLRLGRAGRVARLRLQPHPWLRSHYPDHGQWVPPEVERFVATFNAGASSWRAAPAEALLPLPGNRSLVPDFEFSGADGAAAPLYVELLPRPDAQALAARLAQLTAAGRGDYLLACRATPAVKALGPHPALLTFRRSLLAGPVREALERLRR